MLRAPVRSGSPLATRIRDFAVRRPLVPVLVIATARVVAGERCRPSNQNTLPLGVFDVVEFAM